MESRVLNRINSMFDTPVMQNNLRGLYVEVMVAELIGPGWRSTGGDWAAWDLEHENGTRVEVKQSAKMQTWGKSTSSARFDIKTAIGHYSDGITYVKNDSGERLADLYIFAWHAGTDQRLAKQWKFFVVASGNLPRGQKTIGLSSLQKLAPSTTASHLQGVLAQLISDKVMNT